MGESKSWSWFQLLQVSAGHCRQAGVVAILLAQLLAGCVACMYDNCVSYNENVYLWFVACTSYMLYFVLACLIILFFS